MAHRTDWFHDAKWGVFLHFLGAPPSSSGGAELDADAWNKRCEAFDVEGLAAQLHTVGAGYLYLTLGQNSGHYCTPNATYDRLTGIAPSKCSRRDLVAEMAAALKPYGIRMMVYLPVGAPQFDPAACAALEWQLGAHRQAPFQRRWEAIIREWSLRWGQTVHGWWFDGCYWADVMYRQPDEPNFRSFAAAVRAGNPNSLVAWNPGVKYPPFTMDAEEDYTGGEINEPWRVDSPGRWDKHAQWHILTFLGTYWGRGPVRFSPEEAVRHTRAQTDFGGVVTWDLPFLDGGLLADDTMAVLTAIGKAVNPTRTQPDREPPRLPQLSVECTVPPMRFDDASCREGRFRVTARNPWPTPLQPTLHLTSEPAESLAFPHGASVTLTIQPGKVAMLDIPVIPTGDSGDLTLLVQVEGDVKTRRTFVPQRRPVPLPQLPANADRAALAGALAGLETGSIQAFGRSLGVVRIAVAGDNLVLGGDVYDTDLRRTPMLWDGSCIELFVTRADGAPIRQFFLTPATATEADAVCLHTADKPLPAPQIQFTTEAIPGGYRWLAIAPLVWLLDVPKRPRTFLAELGLTVGVAGSTTERGTLFGSRLPANTSAGYAELET